MNMRTDDEIVKRIEQLNTEEKDWLGTERHNLIEVLPFETAKQFLNEGEQTLTWDQKPRDDTSVLKTMHSYMDFAWEKANSRRELSAERSLNHMSAWLWLLGHEAASEQIREYDRYGKPQLRAICEEFGWDWSKWDDARWTNEELEDGNAPPQNIPALTKN